MTSNGNESQSGPVTSTTAMEGKGDVHYCITISNIVLSNAHLYCYDHYLTSLLLPFSLYAHIGPNSKARRRHGSKPHLFLRACTAKSSYTNRYRSQVTVEHDTHPRLLRCPGSSGEEPAPVPLHNRGRIISLQHILYTSFCS